MARRPETPERRAGREKWKGGLFSQEGLGIFAGVAGHGQERQPLLAVRDHGRDRRIVRLGELRRTAWPEGHHADAAGLAEVLAGDRHLVAGLALVRADLLDFRHITGAAHALCQPRRLGGLGLVALNPAAWP